MVHFYKGLELSKRLNLSIKEKERIHDFIKYIYNQSILSEQREEQIRKISHPIFQKGIYLFYKGAEPAIIEKYLYYHILSSDYHGYKFVEYLLAAETVISYLSGEHPFLTFNKLISYMGEDYVSSINFLDDVSSYFKNNNDLFTLYLEKIKDNNKSYQSQNINLISRMSNLQLEYLLLDINPELLSDGLAMLPVAQRKRVFDIYSNPQKEMILNYIPYKTSGKIFIEYLEKRISGQEKNAFELRRMYYYYNRLYRGEDLAYRLKINFKYKHNLKEVISILLGVAGKIYQEGFHGTRVIIEKIHGEDLLFLKLGLFYLLEGCHPSYIRNIMENYILTGDYRGLDFIKRYIIMDGILSIALRHSEFVMLEKFIQTIGEDFRQMIESYIDEVVQKIE